MAFSLAKLKSILNNKQDGQLAGSGSLEPEIGFKLAIHPSTKVLYVTVIGARHLPSYFGLSSAHGYMVKVKVFPGDKKYETTLQEESWPVWNEDFKFQLKEKEKNIKQNNDLQTQLAGHFVSLTLYASLEKVNIEGNRKLFTKKESVKATKAKLSDKEKNEETKPKGFLEKTFSSFKASKNETTAESRKSNLENKRTVGAATWNFDHKLFQNKLKNGLIGTPDLWRPLAAITSGLSARESKRENQKGMLEVTVLYNASENGLDDTVQVTVNRLRCSVQTMQQHEELNAPLYLKATIFEEKKAECYWKSDRFAPTISARWDPKLSTVKLSVFKANLSKVSIYFSLGCKIKMTKKEILGKAIIDEKSPCADSWMECLRNPGVAKTFWINFI